MRPAATYSVAMGGSFSATERFLSRTSKRSPAPNAAHSQKAG
jgi:hypothetical protein